MYFNQLNMTKTFQNTNLPLTKARAFSSVSTHWMFCLLFFFFSNFFVPLCILSLIYFFYIRL